MLPYRAFIGPSYQSQSSTADVERTVNWYQEYHESKGAKGPQALYPTPGVRTFVTTTDAPGRAFFKYEDRVFAVIGPTFYEVLWDADTETASVVNRGTVLVDASPARITGNGDVANELIVSSGGAAYLYDMVGNTLTLVSTPALSTVRMVDYLGGYFMGLDPTTSTWAISDLADGGTWPVLQAQQRNAATDRWISLLVANQEVWLHGSLTTDVWQLTGAFPFPFAPISGANLQWGIAAPFSSAVLGSPIWLGASQHGSGMVLQAAGYVARRVSTHAVETKIQRYSRIDDAVGWVYQEDGHTFYVLSFPTAQATWCYDAATSQWHERAYWNHVTAAEEAWRPQWHVEAFGKHLMLDRATGTIHETSVSFGSDVGGTEIRRERIAPHIEVQGRKKVFLHSVELDLEVGLGLATGQGSDPTLMLQVSHDAGKTWGPERWISAGAMGKYKTRTRWGKLGSGRDQVVRVIVSDPVPWRIVGAETDYTVGVH